MDCVAYSASHTNYALRSSNLFWLDSNCVRGVLGNPSIKCPPEVPYPISR